MLVLNGHAVQGGYGFLDPGPRAVRHPAALQPGEVRPPFAEFDAVQRATSEGWNDVRAQPVGVRLDRAVTAFVRREEGFDVVTERGTPRLFVARPLWVKGSRPSATAARWLRWYAAAACLRFFGKFLYR
ncbi:hypothetical protein [Streptomyces sp. NPDC002851]